MKKIKFISIFLIIMFCISGFSNVKAAELKTKLDIIQKSADTKYLENDQGYISKSIIDSNKDTGEVKIQLKIANEKKQTEETNKTYEDTEIYIMVSENLSKKEENLNKYITNIEKLSSDIFSKNSKTKIGIIGIKGTISDCSYDKDGKLIKGENDQGKVNGSAENAEIVSKLTNDVEIIKENLKSMNSSKTEYYTNLQAAIRLANSSYSENTNKILICLYDDVPDIAIGICSIVTYGGIFSEYGTAKEAVVGKHKKIASYTKSEILKLKNSNINFILLRPKDTSYDETWYKLSTGEKDFDFDGSPYVKEIYGTLDNPTYGKMYSLDDESLEKIVTEEIYSDIAKEIGTSMENVIVKDYFPKEILDNFTITIPESTDVDKEKLQTDGYITWNIGKLETQNSKTLEYTIKINDMNNASLLNKTIATNEKVEVSYKDYLEKDVTAVLSSSPKIQLSEVKEELTVTVTYSPNTETNGQVIATITTNKRVKKVDGWTLSSDGKSLTKAYTANTTETVHLEDEYGMTKDVLVKVTNIIDRTQKPTSEPKDDTIATGKLPQTGTGIALGVTMLLISLIGCIGLIKYKSYGKLK